MISASFISGFILGMGISFWIGIHIFGGPSIIASNRRINKLREQIEEEKLKRQLLDIQGREAEYK